MGRLRGDRGGSCAGEGGRAGGHGTTFCGYKYAYLRWPNSLVRLSHERVPVLAAVKPTRVGTPRRLYGCVLVEIGPCSHDGPILADGWRGKI